MKPSTFLILTVAACGLVWGCSTVDRALYNEQVVPVTNATGVVTLRTNLVPNPNVETGIAVVGAVPTPYTQIGGAAAAILYGAYMTFRNSRNKKTNVALVKGVETFRAGLPESQDEKLTKILKDRQEAAGIRPEVTKILEQIRK